MNFLSFYVVYICSRIIHSFFWLIGFLTYSWKRKELPPIRNPLLLKSATKLAAEIREGKIKSENVIQAYIDRIREIQPYINAVTIDRFEDALAEAKEVDGLIQSSKFTKQQLEKEKPLLGVPFTVKCLIRVKGMKCTAGSLLFKDRIATEDARAVYLLRKHGGIVLAITNAPEFGSGIETHNFVHGRTNNPYDTARTPGGSSGGESALVSAAGSILGLGNDLMGSNRIPAHFCGLFAHKATAGIISNSGCSPVPPPPLDYLLSTGPLCRYAEDLVLAMKILGSESKVNWNHRQSADFKKLKIYYQTEIKSPYIIKTSEDIIQAIKKVVAHFEEKFGAVSKEISIPHANKSTLIAHYLILSEMQNPIKTFTEGKVNYFNALLENIKCIFRKSIYSFQLIIICTWMRIGFSYNSQKVWYYKELHKSLCEKFDELLDENSVFIYPTFPITAPYHKEIMPLYPNLSYLNLFNITGMPVTQCPMGISGKGMPFGIQIAGRMNNDLLTLSCAIELEKSFMGWIAPDRIEYFRSLKSCYCPTDASCI